MRHWLRLAALALLGGPIRPARPRPTARPRVDLTAAPLREGLARLGVPR